MNCVGDSNFISDNESEIKDDIPEMKNKRDLIVGQPKCRGKQYERNLLKNAQKKFVVLKYQSPVNCIEADEEYIVTAGRDHDINVWDSMEGTHIRRLSGHGGPVTGLYICYLGRVPVNRIIISSSEDETIRQWSLDKGVQLRKFDTNSLITCMGVINEVLAVTGNHEGYVEVRHLTTGELFSSILAHSDAIDAIVVEGNYACSATFGPPSCLKVWEIQYEHTVCIYRIEEWSRLEFGSLALWNSTVFMGAIDQQKLQVINFKTDKKGLIDLERPAGCVQQVRVVDDWILTCSMDKKNCILDVHRTESYEHFGTFNLNLHQVCAVAAVQSNSSLKVVLGGPALAVLNFDFILTQAETNVSSKSFSMTSTYNSKENKKKGHYTQRHKPNIYSEAENSSDSDEHNVGSEQSNMHRNALTGDYEDYSPYKSALCRLHPLSEEIQSRFFQNVAENIKISKENDEMRNKLPLKNQHSVSQPNTPPSSTSPNMKEKTSVKIDEMKAFHCIEPRVLIKKLEEILDRDEKSIGLEPYRTNSDSYEAAEEEKDIFKKWYTDNKYKEKFMTKNDKQNHLETIKEQSNEMKESDLADGEKRSKLLSTNDKNCTNAENGESSSMEKVEKTGKESTKPTKKKSKIKKGKKQNQQKKKKKCTIM